ncbi:MAG TPA: hypothetical protein DG761_07660, partial [Gammaproteobacteria bacterium]|nr:hypothetical protein [Gammaproteobacteria bacterium]
KAASFAIMQFLVANANNEETTGTLWSWYNFGPAFKQLVLDPIRAGQALMPLDPVTNAPLTNYRWADTLTATVDNCSVEIIEETDGIAQARLDLRGVSDLFFDHDIDLGSGTDGTDCIPFITFFAGESDG